MLLNPAKSALENLFDLFNGQNSQTYTSADLDVSAVSVREPDEENARNSTVTITAKAGSEVVKGSQTFTFTRLDVAQIATVKALGEYQSAEGDDLASVKAWVVGQLGLIPAEVDFVETVFPTFSDEENEAETAVLTLKAKDGSYAYLGQVSVTVVEPADGRVRLSEAYASKDLDGFEYPTAEQ